MARRPLKRNEIAVELYDSEDRAVSVVATYVAATRDYFSKSFGNWLPGDPECIEVVSVEAVDPGANVAEVEADTDRIEEAVREAAGESGPDEDDIYERAREREWDHADDERRASHGF